MIDNNIKGITSPLVSIKCTVYNHEPYLRQCLDGFVMQKTNFSFEAIVHDDASTDGSAAIIREYAEKYPDIIKPIYETENQYSKKDGSLEKIMNAAIHPNAKYIAFCEGDDYWIDPYKLQKQVDFMESSPDCSLTYHACKNLFEDLEGYPFGENVKDSYNIHELFFYPFQTATILIKKEVLLSDIFTKVVRVGCMSGDVVLYLVATKFGKIKGVNKQMSVYRRHAGGISNNLRDVRQMYVNYKKWIQIADILGGFLKKEIEKNILKNNIYRILCEKKSFKYYIKAISYGTLYNFRSVYLGNVLIFKYLIYTYVWRKFKLYFNK